MIWTDEIMSGMKKDEIPQIAGKTVARAYQCVWPNNEKTPAACRPMLANVTVEFTDGTRIVMYGAACHDGSADAEYEIQEVPK